MILADTNALIWFLSGDATLGLTARRLIENGDPPAISSISIWEVALSISRGRLKLDSTPTECYAGVLNSGFREMPFTADIGIAAVALEGLHRDPADRIIVATALKHDATLITADRRLLDWTGPLKRHDARL